MIPVNFRGITTMATMAALGMIIIVKMNAREREDYPRATGKIIYLDKHLDNSRVQDTGNYRYLRLRGHPHPFRIALDKQGDSFSPTYEQIDNLKPGDIVSVFYYEHDYMKKEELRYVLFIDKDGIPFFEVGDPKRPAAMAIIGVSGALIVIAILLWRLKKIEF
ncbi:MAG TPA: hypothetical protein VIU12_21225 [Chryseolinea sp.]